MKYGGILWNKRSFEFEWFFFVSLIRNQINVDNLNIYYIYYYTKCVWLITNTLLDRRRKEVLRRTALFNYIEMSWAKLNRKPKKRGENKNRPNIPMKKEWKENIFSKMAKFLMQI